MIADDISEQILILRKCHTQELQVSESTKTGHYFMSMSVCVTPVIKKKKGHLGLMEYYHEKPYRNVPMLYAVSYGQKVVVLDNLKLF